MCQRAVIWPERHQLLRQQHLNEEKSTVGWWDAGRSQMDRLTWCSGSQTKFCCLDLHIFPFSSNCQRIDATTAKNEHQFLAPPGVSQRRGCLSNFTEHVLAKGNVPALASRLAMLLHSVPLNCPLVSCSQLAAPSQLPRAAHVQCVPSRAENVSCKSALRGSVPCWRRRCRVVSTRRTGWAPPGLDTEPTRTSSSALYPDEGEKRGKLETYCE